MELRLILKYSWRNSGFQNDVRNKKDIEYVIQQNLLNKYDKVHIPKIGEYVVCCDIEESLHPDSITGIKSINWKKNLMLKVSRRIGIGSTYAIYGKNKNSRDEKGFYLSTVRMATQEEIKNYIK